MPLPGPAGEGRLVNLIGGCCGTGPEHIAAIKAMASAYEPRRRHGVEPLLRLSGLEPLNYRPDPADLRSTFLMIGERCNVAGSIIYKKAIVEGDYDKALGIALAQVREGRRGRVAVGARQVQASGPPRQGARRRHSARQRALPAL